MIRTLALTTACVALLAGCDRNAGESAFNTEMPLNELMGHVLDPAAWAYWDASGEYMAPDGTWVSRVPATPDSIPEDPSSLEDDLRREALERQWHAAISGAAVVAEGGNLLLLPGRVRKVQNDNGDWSTFARRLSETATRAMEAAEAYDGQAMFDIGGEMYQVCRDCHDKYLVPFLDPKTGELPKGVGADGEPLKR